LPDNLYMGIDIGSVSLNLVIIDDDANLIKRVYRRTTGQPLEALLNIFTELDPHFSTIDGVIATGSGRDLVSSILNVQKENEIITQAKSITHFYPEVRTVIEIGGQDSKLIFIEPDARGGQPVIVDHSLNEICAAGTGSFLDQQAYRLGISIDREFGELALRSNKPASIAGRCSVFAKSDMIHLQQEGIAKEDIVAGLCFALARNYISNLGKGKDFTRPIAFQGGVAANKGVVKAFEKLLELDEGGLIIPENFDVSGALGAAMLAREKGNSHTLQLEKAIENIQHYLIRDVDEKRHSYLQILKVKEIGTSDDLRDRTRKGVEQDTLYLGVDIGAASTNIVALDRNKEIIAKRYILAEGDPVRSVKATLLDIVNDLPESFEVGGVAVTGSGRYFIGDFIGADIVINEITAQAKATVELDNKVDTVFEIGGQDSKYISIKNGSVIDFEMNKVCAAGTGSFLQEQAARLGIDIKDFSRHAFKAQNPADLGTRCTVFMESDLIHHQQVGLSKADLIAGLSYSIAYNYIEKVVGNKKIGDNIYFQGGVASNTSVARAFENILGRDISIPENHNVTGALGAALIAREKRAEAQSQSNFVGFDLSSRKFDIKSFECQHCANHCEIRMVTVGSGRTSYYGGICDRYEIRREGDCKLPDLFKEREDFLLNCLDGSDTGPTSTVIGIPRTLMFYEQLPLWATFFKELGFTVVLSDRTNRQLINKGLQFILAEMCYPMKVAYGHVYSLIEKNVDYVFIPSVIDLKKTSDDVSRSYNCPYIQGLPFILRAAFENKTRILCPTVHMEKENYDLEEQVMKMGKFLGKKAPAIKRALRNSKEAQQDFHEKCQRRGREILENLSRENEAVVLVGKPYNVHDTSLNLNIPKKLQHLGVLAIPFDFLPLESVRLPSHYSNLVWKNEQNLLRALIFAKENKSLNPVLITNYGCGPDAFFMKYLEDTMEDDRYLVLEVDEHSGDAGITTRVEAFVDTLTRPEIVLSTKAKSDLNPVTQCDSITIFKPSKLIRELDKTFYLPYMGWHSNTLAAAFQAVGINAQVLPKPDERSEELGRRYSSSKECHPYQVTTGDLVRMTEMEDFDPDRSAFFMLNFDGSCRLTQYALSEKIVLRKLGFPQVPVIAPLTSIRRDQATKLFGLNWAREIWKSWLATDMLLKKLLHIRPYEMNKGESNQVFDQAIEYIIDGIKTGEFKARLHSAVNAMDQIPVQRDKKPIIGIVGEFYSCMNPWANNHIIEEFEALGAEVRMGPTTTDYLVYFNHVYPNMQFSKGNYAAALYYYVRRGWHTYWQKIIEGMIYKDLKDCVVPDVDLREKRVYPYVSPAIDPVVTVNVDKAVGYAETGCSGIANLIVLNCLYGSLCTAIYKKVQREHQRIPLLTMIYDGLKQTNEKTRIEAFVHQVKLFAARHG